MHPQTATAEFRTLAIDQLRESPTNPRRSFSESKLQELAQSIRAQGVLVPLIVRETEPEMFEVVAGARRFRAAQIAELFAVPVRTVELTDSEAVTLQLVENAIREDVHPYEEAMAYKSLLESSEPRYDVASIALKTGRSAAHIYGRLRMTELIPEAAEAFQANELTAGHAVLIARLPQEQQKKALQAAFRANHNSGERHAFSVRELAQWIRDNLMLTLADAVFDREDPDLYPQAGSCTQCTMRTGANTALFEDFPHDDRCLLASCFQQKVAAHIAREKETNARLVQITQAYYTQVKGDETTLTRSQYTVIEAQGTKPCPAVTPAIVVEGPGKHGQVLEICADPECKVHGKPNHRAEQEAAIRQRTEQWETQERERAKNQERNRALLDGVLDGLPKALTRDDYEMLTVALIEKLDYSDWEAIKERYKLDTDEVQEPDAAAIQLRQKAASATESELIRMLFEIALLPFGYAEEPLEFTNPLASAARRYQPIPAKSSRKRKVVQNKTKSRKSPVKQQGRKTTPRATAHRGGAA